MEYYQDRPRSSLDNLDFLQDSATARSIKKDEVKWCAVAIHTPEDSPLVLDCINFDDLLVEGPEFASEFINKEPLSTGPTSEPYNFYTSSDGLCKTAVILFLRYLINHNGGYVSRNVFPDESPILLHVQVAALARQFLVTSLSERAYHQARCDITYDMATRSDRIADLIPAVRYLYSNPHAIQDQGMRSLIAGWVVENFQQCGLGRCDAFTQTVFEAPLFRHDLLKAMSDALMDVGSPMDIIRLECCKHEVHRFNAPLQVQAMHHFQCAFHLLSMKDDDDRQTVIGPQLEDSVTEDTENKGEGAGRSVALPLRLASDSTAHDSSALIDDWLQDSEYEQSSSSDDDDDHQSEEFVSDTSSVDGYSTDSTLGGQTFVVRRRRDID